MRYAVPQILISISEETNMFTSFCLQDGGTSEMSANLYQTTWWYILQTTVKVITNKTSHIYSIWTPKIYSIANCYTDCTIQNGFPILSHLHNNGIYSEVLVIKNDLIYNILPLCQYWSWQSTCPGLPSMVWTHPVCTLACQLVQDCPIQFDLLQHLMSDYGYLSVKRIWTDQYKYGPLNIFLT